MKLSNLVNFLIVKHFFVVFIIPQRYVLGLMGFLAIVNAYTMRVSLSLAITEMVVSTNSSTAADPDSCPADESSSSTVQVNETNLFLNNSYLKIAL